MDLNHQRELSVKAEKELILIEEKLQKANVDHVDLNLNWILVILPSIPASAGILMQREDIILEWIFYHLNQVKMQNLCGKGL